MFLGISLLHKGTYEINRLIFGVFSPFQISFNLFKLLYLSYIFILGYLRIFFVRKKMFLLVSSEKVKKFTVEFLSLIMKRR